MGYVYLIRNGDLYKIGRTDNLQRRLKQLQPCTVIQTIETDRSRDLEYELHQKYKDKRIPQTEYFRLTESQVEDAAVALGKTRQPGGSSGVPRGSGSSSSSSAGSYRTSSNSGASPGSNKPAVRDNSRKEGVYDRWLREAGEEELAQAREEDREWYKKRSISPRLTNEEQRLVNEGASLEKIKELRRKKRRRWF